MQYEMQYGYFERACSSIDYRLLAPARRRQGNVRQSNITNINYELLFDVLLVDVDCNRTRTGSEVHSYLYSSIAPHKK